MVKKYICELITNMKNKLGIMTYKKKLQVYRRAKKIKHTFSRPSMFSAIKYILKFS